ncbi:MAG TPA: hypothetical protein VLS90_09825 [Thermodesulfobacteriota bacterium]|nr:hypothetical protein [Thermodesulfobacteriota bacterium]
MNVTVKITSRKRNLSLLCPFLAILLLSSGTTICMAQENYEIQVYPSETLEPGKTMVELHSNVALRGTTQTTDGVLRTQGAFHETLEISHGITPWFEIGLYTFTSIQPGMQWEWVGEHIRPRVRVPESWQWPVGLGFSVEFGYQQRRFSTDTWSVEFRPIIDKQIGPWYLAFNPAFGLSLKGEDSGRGLDFNPALKVSYDLTRRVAAGFEYYGGFGPVKRGFDTLSSQQHQLYAVTDLDFGPDWEFNFGVGWGLTESTDRLIVKMILGRRF